MSTATVSPTRTLSFVSLLQTIFVSHLRENLKARKTIILAVIMLLPILGAIGYVASGGESGIDVYKALVDKVIITFLLPLVCLFQGGPAIVDEIEGRTMTYLFLRPVSKPAIFLGKTVAASLISMVLIVLPIIPVFFVSMAAGEGGDGQMQLFAQTMVSLIVGCCAYTTAFACLGALFARSLLAGLLYWVVVEWCLSFVPVIEFGTLNFNIRNVGSLVDPGKLGPIDRMILSEPIEIPFWASYLVLAVVIFGATALGSMVFKNRQYLV